MNYVPFTKYSLMRSRRRLTVLSILAMALLGIAASCKDKNKKKSYCEQAPESCTTVATAKEFFLFKQGSWWVYEEETSHERDSIYVTNHYNGPTYDFAMTTRSALTGYEYNYWPVYASGNQNCSQTGLINSKCVAIKEDKGKPGDYVGEGYCFFVNYNVNDYIGSFNVYYENNFVSVDEIISNYSLGNFTFDKVVKMHELAAVLDNNQPKNCYYSRGVGLIRRELLDSNQVWNLVSYHIEP